MRPPDYLKTPTKKSTISDEVNYVTKIHDRFKAYHDVNLYNTLENWRFYWGKNAADGLGQWPRAAVARMIQQGKQLITYNITKPTIDAIAGGILQLPFDPEFIPINQEVTSLTECATKAMYSDKEQMNWKSAYHELIIGGLIYEGVIKMEIDTEFDDLGNIAFRPQLPGSVFFSPTWKTISSKDCKAVTRELWLTAQEMLDTYKNASDAIEMQAERDKKDGTHFGPYTGITPYQMTGDKWGSKHRVIELYEMVPVKKNNDFLITGTEDILIPDGDAQTKIEWLGRNYPDWSPDMVYEKPYTEQVCMLRTACESLVQGRLLENEKTEVQAGRTPFFLWSSTRYNGESHGIIDAVKDAQVNLNYWEAMLTYKMQAEGGGGAQFTDPSMFKDKNEYEKFVNKRNNPNSLFKLKPGMIEGGKVPTVPVTSTKFPRELYENINHIFEKVWPNISKTSPSSVGRPEPGNQTSGKLFQMMKIQSDTMVYTIHYGLRQFWNDVFEAYLLQASQTYSNESVPRTFNCDGETITLNEKIEGKDGSVMIKNDASKLREIRHKIIISETQESPTDKMNNVAILSEYMNSIPPENIASRSLISSEIAQNIDQFSAEMKNKIKIVTDKETEVALKTLELNAVNLEVQISQAKQMMVPTPDTQKPAEPIETTEPIETAEPTAEPTEEQQTPLSQSLGGINE